MKTIIKKLCALILCLATVSTLQAKDLLETAAFTGKFTILEKAIKSAGLAEALSGKGPFTVFAPTDEAFMRLPKGTIATLLKPENKAMLIDILTYHVVAGEVDGSTAVKLSEAKALNGKKLTIAFKNAALYINESKVVTTDVKASNGVIHIIDSVILPPAVKPVSAENISQKILNDAIDVGSDLYNEGNKSACVKIYEIAVRAVLAIKPKQLTDKEFTKMNKALAKVANQNDSKENAWTLRYVMDAALKTMIRAK